MASKGFKCDKCGADVEAAIDHPTTRGAMTGAKNQMTVKFLSQRMGKETVFDVVKSKDEKGVETTERVEKEVDVMLPESILVKLDLCDNCYASFTQEFSVLKK